MKPMVKTLEIAIESLQQLRAEIELGIGELDAGLGEEVDIEEVIRQAREEHAKTA